MEKTIELKELQLHLGDYARKVKEGESFIVFKQSNPLFKIIPLSGKEWEEAIDFTKIKKGGVDIKDILSRL